MLNMREWVDPPYVESPAELAQDLGVSKWIASVLARRGFMDVKSARGFLDPSAYTPAQPGELPGLNSAVDRLQQALRQGEHILVWGDFDVDGQTATALFVERLRELGGVVSYHIPIRAQESHGVSLPVLQQFLHGLNSPNLVQTCDTGITAFDAAEYAHSMHVDFLITDHHELACQPDTLALFDSSNTVSSSIISQPHNSHGTIGNVARIGLDVGNSLGYAVFGHSKGSASGHYAVLQGDPDYDPNTYINFRNGALLHFRINNNSLIVLDNGAFQNNSSGLLTLGTSANPWGTTYIGPTFISGTAVIGNFQSNTHQITGSLNITGSVFASQISSSNGAFIQNNLRVTGSSGTSFAIGDITSINRIQTYTTEPKIRILDDGNNYGIVGIRRSRFESEYAHCFQLEYEGPFRPDPGEIAEGRFFTLAEVGAMVGTGTLTPMFEYELPMLRAARG